MLPASRLGREVAAVFSPGGALSSSLPGFEARPGQARLAVAWAEALSGGRILVAEAATGIGKTLAYLVPVVLSGRKAVISTGTKTLQQQLAENDIPLVRKALRRPFSCVVAKGRANYLCRRRWARFAAEPSFEFPGEAGRFAAMREFAETTRTGDISECPGIPEDFRAWADVNARSETCDASSCAETDRCFLMEVRRRAAQADVVIANHHLFFADLSLRNRGGGHAFAEILPSADVVVFDEAHGIEETASSFFGVTVSLGRALELCRDLRRVCGTGGNAWRPLLPSIEGMRRAAEALFGVAGSAEGRFSLPVPGAAPLFDRCSDEVRRACEELSLSIAGIPSPGGEGAVGEAEAFLRRVRSFLEDFDAILSADPSVAVAWGERRGHAVSLSRTPVEVSSILSGMLWGGPSAVLLASATLSVAGDLSYFRERVGLAAVDAGELIVDNEFDFGSRAMAFVPGGMPDPGEDEFPAAAARETAGILSLSGGGALVLCTSYRALGAITEALRDAIPFTLFVQGEAPRPHLLRAFREEGDAVLAGTGTFWEGIDVPGESLRCVVIDKLPFAPPADPVVAARIRAVRERGQDPFHAYQLPEAVLALRQGVGRLLRRMDDYGIVAILDRRVMTKGYGAAFRDSLPPMPWTRDRGDVEAFYLRFRPAGRRGREEGR